MNLRLEQATQSLAADRNACREKAGYYRNLIADVGGDSAHALQGVAERYEWVARFMDEALPRLNAERDK